MRLARSTRLALGFSVVLGIAGCGSEPETPPPAPAGNDAPDTDRPEADIDEGGADAALPPEQRP